MAIILISSEATTSLAPPGMILSCQWDCDGTRLYSSMLCTPDDLSDNQFWDELETSMARWFVSHKRKPGEVARLPTIQPC